ncbi:MAG: hypothetical protein WD555_03670 [Fulvivirga sp.]
MPKFKEGNPGRPKGAKNKINIQIRDMIQNLFDDNFDKIQQDMDKLDPKDRLKFITDLLPYLLPKLQSTNLSTDIDLEEMTDQELDRIITKITNG